MLFLLFEKGTYFLPEPLTEVQIEQTMDRDVTFALESCGAINSTATTNSHFQVLWNGAMGDCLIDSITQVCSFFAFFPCL